MQAMEAIIELIAALIGALVQLLFGLLAAVAGLVAVLVEFIFLALTQGLSTASKQYNHRKKHRSERLEAAKPAADASQSKDASSISLKHSAIFASIVFVVIICSVITWVVRDRIRKQRVAETRSKIEKLADTFAQQIKDDGIVDPEAGMLRDRDAWQQPIELFVDKALLGSMVVVRSSGPDRKSGSIDDILAIRVIRASATDIGGELANRGIKALRDRVDRLLPGGDKKQLPEDVEVDEQ